jgi:hypothetical protein
MSFGERVFVPSLGKVRLHITVYIFSTLSCMQVYFIYFLLSGHEGETYDINIGHNSPVTHFVKRKLDVVLRDETKPEKAGC